jgi:hypothetical protein
MQGDWVPYDVAAAIAFAMADERDAAGKLYAGAMVKCNATFPE